MGWRKKLRLHTNDSSFNSTLWHYEMSTDYGCYGSAKIKARSQSHLNVEILAPQIQDIILDFYDCEKITGKMADKYSLKN